MRTLVLVGIVLVGCASKADDLEALRREAYALADGYQPTLDALAVRTLRLKARFNGDLPDMYNALALANIADDTLGLWSFDQIKPAGPDWRAMPTTLLGFREFVHTHVDDIVKQGDLPHLQRLVQDLERRYIKGIATVEDDLFAVESWLDAGNRLTGKIP
jgi:hypothetical protein